MVLQPIVENALLHGILESENEIGIITIRGYFEENNITLLVQDNGLGMPKEIKNSMLSSVLSNKFHGYGIKNINEKLILLFGSQYGLSFESTKGQGTLVKIRFPPI